MNCFLLLIDFGTLVLIWMVQLLIYPSFKYFTREKLIIWHRIYTRNMGYIVGPLMLAQMALHAFVAYSNPVFQNFISLTLIMIIWVLTFLIFVPIHNNISKGKFETDSLLKIGILNWWRTVLWTLVFILALFPA
jgi:uncharacterized protein YacL